MKPFLSICIPSYNRGNRALSLVNKLLQFKFDESVIEIVVSNNGSTENVEGYEQIKAIKDKRLVYSEFNENRFYHGNINQVIRLSRGEFCLIISDEDSILEESLGAYIQLLKENPNVGVLRSMSDKQYANINAGYYPAGGKAISQIFMQNNYISGIFYNRRIITNELIDELEIRYKDNEMYKSYIHLIIDIYAALSGIYLTFNLLLVIEGVAEINKTNFKKTYASWQMRVEHLRGILDIIQDLPIDNETYSLIFVRAIAKTAYLISLMKEKYKEEGNCWNDVVRACCEEMEKVIFDEKQVVTKDCINEIHSIIIEKLRIDPIEKRVFLSICIPSYNRGHRARILVDKLLAMQGFDDVEIVISNNGSTKNTEGYEYIKNINNARLRYFEFDENRFYHGNINQVIRMADGEFCLIVSDEDDVIEENLRAYIQLLEERPEIAVLRAATSVQYRTLEDKYYSGGDEAVKSVCMLNNYVSGMIYNRGVINDELINKLEYKYYKNKMYIYYIHMVLDLYAATKGAFVTLSLPLITEGMPESNIPVYNSYEARIEQMCGMCDVVKDIEASPAIRYELASTVAIKTAYLIRLAKEQYQEEWQKIVREVCSKMENVLYQEKNMVPEEILIPLDKILKKILNSV